MRKLTYKQAATCREKLKVQVTPEQSEKMQLAWFAAGKRWRDGGDKVAHTTFKFLWLSNDLMMTNCAEYFILHKNEEIELIDDLSQHDFASQQEVWMWLAQGNQIKEIATGDVAVFKNGVLYRNDFASNSNFFDFMEWEKHTPPKLIRVNGIEVPAPLESLDGVDCWVYIPDLAVQEKCTRLSVALCYQKIHDGEFSIDTCYATKEGAIKRAEAMVKFEVVE
jgi:hypothetical protein